MVLLMSRGVRLLRMIFQTGEVRAGLEGVKSIQVTPMSIFTRKMILW
jgi:hypothetical protein